MTYRPTAVAAALVLALTLSLGAGTAQAKWVRTWAASPQPPTQALGPFPATPSFRDQTLRQVVRTSAGGRWVRIRLSNEYGTKPLVVGAARIGLAGAGGDVAPGSNRALTFAGSERAVIAPGAPLLSDPLEMDVPALGRLAVSLYLPEDTGQCTCHGTSMQTLYIAPGDQTAAPSLPAAAGPAPSPRAFLMGVEVDALEPSATIVAFGDSITDGVGATVNADRRWPDRLAERLAERSSSIFAVANQGISGNRVLRDGFAQSALARFDRDVLAVPGARYVIIFEGINDIGRSEPLSGQFASLFGPPDPMTAEDMIAGYRQLIARGRAQGLKVIGATIAPYRGAATFSPAGEAKRTAINTWIRTSGAFDGVIDFDAVLRDPADPTQMRAGYHSGDFLHGSDAGYRAMADAIDLSLFAPARD